MTIGSRCVPLVLVLVLAAAPRLAWYWTHQPDLPPDSYGYLNVAREWRGELVPEGLWDDRALLPWDNKATRTPGYPLFLDLVFALAGRSPTPEAALAEPRRILSAENGPRARHLKHLQTDENVRVVQAVQHVLGVGATCLAFLTIVEWTGSVAAGVLGALVAIGWNPVWIMMFEPAVLTETLAGVLLIVMMWLVSIPSSSSVKEHLAATLCGLAVLVRPAMLVSCTPIVAYLVWRRRGEGVSAARVLIAPMLIVALLIANNGVRYQYWGIVSLTGAILMSHVSDHPEGLREPLRALGHHVHNNRFGGQTLQYVMSIDHNNRPYLDIAREVQSAAFAFIVDHPRWYFASVASGILDFFSPPLRLVPGDRNVVRLHFPMLWRLLSVGDVLMLLVGLTAMFVRVSPAVKLAPVIFLVSAAGTALMAHTENQRYAAPIVPLVLMSGVTVVARPFHKR